MVLIFSVLRFSLLKFQAFWWEWSVHCLKLQFARIVRVFIFTKVQKIHFHRISRKTFSQNLTMYDEIFIIRVELTIIFAFSKLKDPVRRVFIIIWQDFYHLFCFCRLQYLRVILPEFKIKVQFLVGFYQRWTFYPWTKYCNRKYWDWPHLLFSSIYYLRVPLFRRCKNSFNVQFCINFGNGIGDFL